MVWLHLNCLKDHHCHKLWLQRNSLNDEPKYCMFAEYGELTFIESKVMTTVHPRAFPALIIGSTGPVVSIIQMGAKTTVRLTMNQMWSTTISLRNRNALRSGMCVPHQMCPDWFGQLGGQWNSLKRGWWWSMLPKQGGSGETDKRRTEWDNMFSAGSLCCLTENFT